VPNEIDESLELLSERVPTGPEEVGTMLMAIVVGDDVSTDLDGGNPTGMERCCHATGERQAARDRLRPAVAPAPLVRVSPHVDDGVVAREPEHDVEIVQKHIVDHARMDPFGRRASADGPNM
jgi:ribonucleotide monophosphatase NagD (HAD superfamily)